MPDAETSGGEAYDLIVVGSGPAGLMAAGTAAISGARVLVLEKNRDPGRKLLISGGGRCNFTNAEFDLHRLVAKYGSAGKALLSPFSRMGPAEVLAFFESHGMPYKIEDENRAFPRSDASRSVLAVLTAYARDGGVEIRTNTSVDGLVIENGRVTGVHSGSRTIRATAVVVATGGLARPDTGSTGDGFLWLESAGHTIVRPAPALVPIIVEEPWVERLQGLAFPEVRITVRTPDAVIAKRDGKILFTHFGLSGPGILNLASTIADAASSDRTPGWNVQVALDFFPSEDAGALDRRLLETIAAHPLRKLRTILEEFVPPRLVQQVLTNVAAPDDLTGATVPKVIRKKVVQELKGLRLTFRALQSEDWAVVSSGGVPVEEVEFRTMQSRRVSGLYIVGDMLHIDRPSGGYSLQICWATGYVAGSSAC